MENNPPNNIISDLSIMVRPEDRTTDGNILPEVRKGIVDKLMEYPSGDLMKPHQLARTIGVSAKTAALLAREAMVRRSVNQPYALMVEKDWLWKRIEDALSFPEENSEQKAANAKYIVSLFREYHELCNMMPEEENDTDAPQVYKIAGHIGKNMLKIFEENAKTNDKADGRHHAQDSLSPLYPD